MWVGRTLTFQFLNAALLWRQRLGLGRDAILFLPQLLDPASHDGFADIHGLAGLGDGVMLLNNQSGSFSLEFRRESTTRSIHKTPVVGGEITT